MNDNFAYNDTIADTTRTSTILDTEEFFERFLFQDVLNMTALTEVSDKTAIDLKDLQDEAYQNLYTLIQKFRGISIQDEHSGDEILGIFELFLKNYYQHFRSSMEKLLKEKSPTKVAYYLGKNSEKFLQMLDLFIKEIEREIL